jgi:hypothetical protein
LLFDSWHRTQVLVVIRYHSQTTRDKEAVYQYSEQPTGLDVSDLSGNEGAIQPDVEKAFNQPLSEIKSVVKDHSAQIFLCHLPRGI